MEKTYYSISIMLGISFLIGSFAIGISYYVSFEQQRQSLIETAQSQARLIEAMGKFDVKHNRQDHPDGSFGATLSQVLEAHATGKGFRETGEFILAKRDGDRIIFLTGRRFLNMGIPMPVLFEGNIAEPMRHALKGESGSMEGLDYRGEPVLAAFEPVKWSDHKIGIVAKMDISEIRRPFAIAGLITGLLAMSLLGFGIFLFKRFTRPLTRFDLEKFLNKRIDDYRLLAPPVFMAGIIFYIDISIPLGVATGVPYVALFLFSILSPTRFFIISIALLGTVMTVIGFFVSPAGGVLWVVLMNRFLSIFAIWTTAILVLYHKESEIKAINIAGKFRKSQEIAHVGSWEWEIANNRVSWSDEAFRIYGYKPDVADVTFEIFENCIHPADKNTVLEAINDALSDDKKIYDIEHRVIGPDKKEKAVHAQGEIILRNNSGEALRMVGTVQDITERKKTEELVSRFGRILDNSSNEVFIFDADSLKFLHVNQGAINNLGYSVDEILRFTPIDLKTEFTMETFSKMLEPLRSREKEHILFTTVHKRKDGSTYPIEVRLQLSIDETLPVFMAIIQDVTERQKAEDALRESEEWLRKLFEAAFEGIVITESGNIFECNDAFVVMFGYTHDELIGMSMINLIVPEDRHIVIGNITQGYEGVYEAGGLKKKGSTFVMEIHGTATPYKGRMARITAIRDITDRKRAEEKLKLSAMVFDNASEGVVVTDIDGVIQYVNLSFSQITGYSSKEAIRKNVKILKSNRQDKKFYGEMWQCLLEKGEWKGEVWNRHKSGELYLIEQSINAIKDADGKNIQYASVFHDITEIRQSADEIAYHAYHDALTGLPNRSLFLDRLKQAISRAARDKQKFALLFIDIDNFKRVNDNFGHVAGDLLIKGTGMRLITCVRETDTVSRYAGDEFLIILEHMEGEQSISSIAEKIIESMSEPYMYQKKKIVTTVSIGVAIYPDDGQSVEDLIKNADMAMYYVKEHHKNSYSFFKKELNEKATERYGLEQKMIQAIEKNEFVVYYQPKVNLSTGRITSMEALVRWRSGGELVSPGVFIPLAEDTGLIVPIGEFVMRSACEHLKKWQGQGHQELVISVNLSAHQLDKGEIQKVVKSTIVTTGIKPSSLCLEVTETSIMKNMDIALASLEELKKMGVRISLDDFGTGYSSLSYLRKFPIDEIKIDRSFVMNIPENRDDTTIATTIIRMAHNLNLSVVAEGVETNAQLDFLKEARCDEMQGYLFSPPLPAEEMEKLLKREKP